ncbi:putative oxidoreductase YxbG [Planktothrix tepida]|uniref:Short-chain dehydrogenase/reductase SDR n=2 Tax=Planktothrix TaxID=54304 RepID=A0A1J1LU62_9CYAN|nr:MULTISPECIES: SDR family NAD(P)-dependent oxidoreductase [Planktothrix]CAD5918617.1 putative oxidoreductase YxbG [Planktothrix pseudagardhii]CAD5982118.1 putative oxidoreductase YxbG [Planktothrix tepida]CUR35742.1 Short-chain dehydrogenase/reductase SDR [Planktothrix tepida PCC 9214]
MLLKDKVAVISGAGSGIGQATALLLAKEGAKVATLDRTPAKSQQTVDQIKQAGGEAMMMVADISHWEQVQPSMDKIAESWGKIDIVFANAGINGVWAPLDELSPEEWKTTISINLDGTFYTLKYALPYLKKQGGSVVITSSVNGTRMFSNSGATAYASTKAAQVAFAKMTALELAKYKIRVNVICPGAITTEIDQNTEREDLEEAQEPVEFPEGEIPLTNGQPGTSEQVAQLVLFLVSDASSHITGTEVWIDGGQSLLQG